MINSRVFAALSAGLLVCSPFAKAQNVPEVYDPDLMLYALSDNGTYSIASSTEDANDGNPRVTGGTLLNINTKERTAIDAPAGWINITDIADNGIVVGSSGRQPGYWDPSTLEWTTFKVPAAWGTACFNAVTPDAKFAVGYYNGVMSDFNAYPMYFDLTTGESRELTNLPEVDMTGIDQEQNAFYALSPDGRYVLGQMSQSYLMPTALFSYVYDMETQTWDPIGFDYDPATKTFKAQVEGLHFINSQAMSPDGKWVTGSAYMVKNGGDFEGGSEGYYSYRYNVADKSFELYSNDQDANIGAYSITNDGTVLAASPFQNPYPTGYVRSGNFFISIDQIFSNVYGLNIQDEIHDPVSGTFWAVSNDGLTAVMGSYTNSYILRMPEPFAQAAAKVDLLSNYTVNIPENSKISRISELKVTFDRPIECLEYPQNVTLTDEDGNVVRTALGFSLDPANNNVVVVTFRSTSLSPGKKYAVNIPAEMVWLKGDRSIKSKAIQISYVGRNEGAIQLVSASPSNGAALAYFNATSDYLSLTFDTPVAVSSTGSCTLYNTDDNSVVANFSASVSGNTVNFFPTSTYMLYRGSHYKVVVAQGTVTDLSGQGGCDELTFNYNGAYVRELSDSDKYIFYSDCENYEQFMYWKSTFNQPSSIPTSWGFTKENIWMLVMDDKESNNNALAAISMFTPAGQADDWLITPQLFITDPTVVLTFDAQRFRQSKQDVLKVYVYEDDAVYNYFSLDLEEKFKADGDLIFDEVVPAGDSDDRLEGEWGHYTIPLEKYAGKNVYIAFVNYNYDQSAIFLDNIKVMREINFAITNQTPTSIVDAADVAVQGIVTIGAELAEYSGIKLTLMHDGNIVSEINDTDAKLSYGDSYKFSFPDRLGLEVGKENTYTIMVEAGEDSSSFQYTVKDLVFEPYKKVVLEEYTGSACGNCPLGIVAIEHISEIFGDHFIPVTLRTYQNDIYASGAVDYTTFLGLNAAPTGKINRGSILSPMVQNADSRYLFSGDGLIDSDGNEVYLWTDAVRDELETPAEASVEFSSTYNDFNGELSIPVTVRFALDQTDKSYGVFAVVIENNLPTIQLNYFSSISEPNLGPWGAGGMYSQSTVSAWKADDVTRFVVNGNNFNGEAFPQSAFAANESCQLTLNTYMPLTSVTNIDNCEVVVMLIDRSSGRIVNANIAKLGDSAGISDVVTDGSDAPAVYYDLQGLPVADPQPGHIYIRVQGDKATKIRL